MNTKGSMGKFLSVLSRLAVLTLLLAGCSEQPNPEDSSAPKAAAPMVIEPLVRVGEVRAGMTAEQVVRALGEPARRTRNALSYPRRGFAVALSDEGMVTAVLCGDVTGLNGPFTKAFSGQTTNGIAMRSTRDEVIRAFGEPSEDRKLMAGMESLKYADKGITFTLQSGKVHHMNIWLTGGEPASKAVPIEIVPSATQ